MLQHCLKMLSHLPRSRLIYQNQEWSSQDLVNKAISLMPFLKKTHRENKPIAICLPNSPLLVSMHLAAFHLGIPIVPIIFEQTKEFVEEAVKLTRSCALINKETIIEESFSSQSLPDSSVDSKQLAMIIFSSGTTGVLKGIMHSYQSAYDFLENLVEILSVDNHPTYVVAQPMGHIGGIITTLLTLLHEGTAVLLEKFEASDYLNTLTRYKPTHINLHTPLFYELINHPALDKNGFSKIKTCFAGGDTIPENLPEVFTQVTGAKMRTGYGMTETGIVILNTNPYGKYKLSSGKKVDSTNLELRNPQGKPVKIGEAGEIWIKSNACCLGYWEAEELNKNTIVDGWFRTGDLASVDKGYYYHLGRLSNIIYRGKEPLYPAQIENLLFEHPYIAASAVIAFPDPVENNVPIFFIQLKPNIDSKKSEQEIRNFIQQHLPAACLPKNIIFIEKMPTNLTGKIDRKALSKLV